MKPLPVLPSVSAFAGVLLLAVGSIAPYFPPAAQPAYPIAPDTAFLQRLFPAVPAEWVVGRLLCLLAGVALLWGWLRDGSAFPEPSMTLPVVAATPPRRVRIALWLAGLQLAAGIGATLLPRSGQLAYMLWFALPPLVLVRWSPPSLRFDAGKAFALSILVTAGWLLARVPLSWRSPRMADLTDSWVGLQLMAQAAEPEFNLLTDRFMAGAGTSFHLVLQGAALLARLETESALPIAQAAQFFWLSVAGVLVGIVAARLFGPASAPVATAVLLFSPLVSTMTLTPLPLFFGPLAGAMLMCLLVQFRARPSPAVLAWLGSAAGVAATLHSVFPAAALLMASAVWSAFRSLRLDRRSVAVAVLLFASGVVTMIPDICALPSILASHTRGNQHWVVHEAAGFGQISASGSEAIIESAVVRLFDTPVSALLTPFASPRTPLRGTGDVMFDPLGTVFAAFGIAVCLRSLRVSWLARSFLALLLVSILPATVASADRVSIFRFLITPVPMSLLAALGWHWVGRRLGRTAQSYFAAVVVIIVAMGGLLIFEVVNPRILPSAWTTIALRAAPAASPPAAILFDHPDPHSFPYWRLAEISRALSRGAVGSRVFEGASSLAGGDEVYFWSPGSEEDQKIGQAVCAAWPDSTLYVLSDSAGLSRAFAARPPAVGWEPALPPSRWQALRCGAQLPTEAAWAAEVMREARTLLARGDRQRALVVVRAAARSNFVQVELFTTAAEVLLAADATVAEVKEAVHWARRACQISQNRDPRALTSLAFALAADGQFEQALEAARRAEELARERGDQDLLIRLEGLRADRRTAGER